MKLLLLNLLHVNLERQLSNHDTVSRNPNQWSDVTLSPIWLMILIKLDILMLFFNKKLKKRTLKLGWVADFTHFSFIDSVTTNSSAQTYRIDLIQR